MQTLTTVAKAATGESSDLFASLGIDWKMLLFQIIAFAMLLWILNKYVFPVIVKSIDEREKKITEGRRLAEEAAEKASSAQEEIAKMMKRAQKDAATIISDAKETANKIAEESDKKNKERAERIIAGAHADIAREVASAKKDLYNEMLDLVTLATEKVAGKEVTKSIDKKTIASAIEKAKQ